MFGVTRCFVLFCASVNPREFGPEDTTQRPRREILYTASVTAGRAGGRAVKGGAGGAGRVGTQDNDVERRTLYFVGCTEGDLVGCDVGVYVGFDEGSKLGCALGADVGV